MNMIHVKNENHAIDPDPTTRSGAVRIDMTNGGFSLSELTLSLGIIGSAMLVILGLMGTSLNQGGSARLHQEAAQAARQAFAELELRADAARRSNTPLSISELGELEWVFGSGLQPVDPDSPEDAIYRVTLEFPAAPATPPNDGTQAPGMTPLQPVELVVRHPWRGRETPDQKEDRTISRLRL